MRTDCKINTRSVKCPNAWHLGFGLRVANVGNLIVYKEYHKDASFALRTGRMIGRITAPKIEPTDSEIEGWILAMVLSDDCTHLFERWINPEWVTEVREMPANLLRFLAQPDWPDYNTMRRAGERGSLSEHYIAASGLVQEK